MLMRKILQSLILFAFLLIPLFLNSQSTRISLNMHNSTINEVLNEIESKSDYTFLVNQKLINLNRQVDAVYSNTSISEILKNLFKNEPVNIVLSEKQIILSPVKSSGEFKQNQEKVISGKVVDSKDKLGLPGTTVIVKGTSKGTATDFDGKYSISISDENAILVFSYIGYTSQEIEVQNSNVINVELEETSKVLEGVVVTALGIKREEKALGYATQKVQGEAMQKVKTIDPTSALTGKVAGLTIKNSSNFGVNADLTLRGEKPILVIDGVPTENMTLNDISSDDIQNIDVLKGATASALYGSRGSGGAIMVTTIGGNSKKKGLSVKLNSSSMYNAGFVVEPKTQKSYSSGFNGKYGDDYVWGDKLDIGRTATLWDPVLKEWKENSLLESKGKNNLKNFQEPGYTTNNNISIINSGENSTLRSSFTHIFNKGQFPNQKQTKMIYTFGGDIRYKHLDLESNMSYTKHTSPNIRGNQYSGGLLYNLIGWLGAEWDIRDYTDYWLVKDVSQNWFNTVWYDNPYFLANEVIQTADRDIVNGFVSATYKFTPWLKLTARSGLDFYINRSNYRNAISAANAWDQKGYYEEERSNGYSSNTDVILTAEKSFGNFRFDGLAGGGLFFKKDDYLDEFTKGGLGIPGYYSLKSSVDPIGWGINLYQKQVNSLYARTSFSYKSLAFLDLTARGDWSSTLLPENNPYIYPSVGGSFVTSEVLPKISWLDFWKLRGSWTVSKKPADIYEIANPYIVSTNVWGGYNGANFPTTLKSPDIFAESAQTLELGTEARFFKNRLSLDFSWYRKLMYDFITSANMSNASGFYSKTINSDEILAKKGIELTLKGTLMKNRTFQWDMYTNWSNYVTRYVQLDSVYTPDQYWIYEGARADAYTVYDWVRDGEGNIVHNQGFPVRSDYETVWGYSDPKWVWGWGTSLTYKSVSLNIALDGRIGGLSFSRLDALLWHSGAHIDTDNEWRYDEVVNGKQNYIGNGVKVVSGAVIYDSYGRILEDTRVFAPNDKEVSYERYIKDNYQRGPWSWCSQSILDETFLKLREISLSFKVPQKFLKYVSMSDLNLSLIGQNLFYWGKEYKQSDPDGGGTWDLVSPSIRYVGLNINANF